MSSDRSTVEYNQFLNLPPEILFKFLEKGQVDLETIFNLSLVHTDLRKSFLDKGFWNPLFESILNNYYPNQDIQELTTSRQYGGNFVDTHLPYAPDYRKILLHRVNTEKRVLGEKQKLFQIIRDGNNDKKTLKALKANNLTYDDLLLESYTGEKLIELISRSKRQVILDFIFSELILPKRNSETITFDEFMKWGVYCNQSPTSFQSDADFIAGITNNNWKGGLNALQIACSTNNLEWVNALVNHVTLSPDLLFYAVPNIEILKVLLSKGLNINSEKFSEGTPLQQAILMGDEKCVKFLLENGADANFVPEYALSYRDLPLMMAIKKPVIFELLLKSKADPNLRGNRVVSETTFEKACEASVWYIPSILTEKPSFATQSILKRQEKISPSINLLLDHGFNVNPDRPERPLELAINRCNDQIVKRIIDKGAKIEAEDILECMNKQRFEIAHYLISKVNKEVISNDNVITILTSLFPKKIAEKYPGETTNKIVAYNQPAMDKLFSLIIEEKLFPLDDPLNPEMLIRWQLDNPGFYLPSLTNTISDITSKVNLQTEEKMQLDCLQTLGTMISSLNTPSQKRSIFSETNQHEMKWMTARINEAYKSSPEIFVEWLNRFNFQLIADENSRLIVLNELNKITPLNECIKDPHQLLKISEFIINYKGKADNSIQAIDLILKAKPLFKVPEYTNLVERCDELMSKLNDQVRPDRK